MQNVFAERLIYWLLRTAIHVGLSLGCLESKRLKRLQTSALYDELTAHGLNKSQISSICDVAQSTVTNWSRVAQKPYGWPEGGSMVRRVLETLEFNDGSLDLFTLEDLVFAGGRDKLEELGEIDKPPIFTHRLGLALNLLTQWGYVTADGGPTTLRYQLTLRYHREAARNMTEPFIEPAEVFDDAVALANALVQPSPTPEAVLFSPGFLQRSGLSAERARRVLEWCAELKATGAEPPILEERGAGGRSFLPHPTAKLSNGDDPTVDQVASIQLVRRVKSFLVWLAREPERSRISLQTFSFRARPGDLSPMLASHCRDFIRPLPELEVKAEGANDALTYSFNWFGYEVDADGVKSTGSSPLA